MYYAFSFFVYNISLEILLIYFLIKKTKFVLNETLKSDKFKTNLLKKAIKEYEDAYEKSKDKIHLNVNTANHPNLLYFLKNVLGMKISMEDNTLYSSFRKDRGANCLYAVFGTTKELACEFSIDDYFDVLDEDFREVLKLGIF